MNNILSILNDLKTQVDALVQQLDIDGKAAKAAELEKQATAPDFWDDPESAQKAMQQMSKLKSTIEPWQKLRARVNDANELAELEDDDLLEELTRETETLQAQVEKMAFQAMLSGPHDSEDAVLAIHAGAGGTDAQDWAEILERMYIRWAEQNGYKVDILDRSDGDEAGVKSVTMSIQSGPFPYGYLRSEQGVHRLVRISPFNAAGKRQTSFAKVELWPDIHDEIDIEVNPNDLRIDTYRASGAGGQHVQKNDTAVRLTHTPTGIVVQCQNQRSQTQNKERAMQLLKARLLELEQEKQDAELAELKGENVDAGWGNQIRSYVMHPYQLVKDLRTEHETGNVSAVLDGKLTEFMEAYLRAKINKSGVAS